MRPSYLFLEYIIVQIAKYRVNEVDKMFIDTVQNILYSTVLVYKFMFILLKW